MILSKTPLAAVLTIAGFQLVCHGQTAVRPQFETAEIANSPTLVGAEPTGGSVAVLDEGNVVTDSGDLGEQWVYRETARPKSITASVEISALHTSNVALTARDEAEDNYLYGSIAVAWQHSFGNGLTADLGAQQAVFRYDDFSLLNFDSLNLGAGISGKIPVVANAAWFARYNFNRLTAENYGSELFTSHSFLVGAQQVYQLSRADSIFVGASGQINFSDPQELERREYGIYGGYTLAITRSISCDATYRASLYDYNQTDRRDFNQTLSVGLRWRPVETFAAAVSASGGLNRSDASAFDYNLLNAGLSLSLTHQF